MTEVLATPTVPVSWGELLDKLTILAIKLDRIRDAAAHANVRKEHDLLRSIASPVLDRREIAGLLRRLGEVNEALWRIEDDIRLREAAGDFGPTFVQLARSVYKTNDERAAVKRELNALLGSELVEEKSYAQPPLFFRSAGG